MSRKEKPTFVTEQEPFPKRLKELLDETQTTQAELAHFIGCTRQAISLYATGQSTPDIKILKKISEYFKVSSDYLLGISEVKTTDTTVKGICEYTGLSDDALKEITVLKKSKYYFSCFIKLLESSAMSGIVVIISQFLHDKCDSYKEVIKQREHIRRHIKKSLSNNPSYNFLSDYKHLDLITSESSFEKSMNFQEWEFQQNLIKMANAFIDDHLKKPEELEVSFYDFIKECNPGAFNEVSFYDFIKECNPEEFNEVLLEMAKEQYDKLFNNSCENKKTMSND